MTQPTPEQIQEALVAQEAQRVLTTSARMHPDSDDRWLLPDQTILHVQGYCHPLVALRVVLDGGTSQYFERLHCEFLHCEFLQLVQDATLLRS